MDTLQTWIIIGVPGMVTVAALLVGRNQSRALLAYPVLLGLVATFLTVPEDIISAIAIGLLAFLMISFGRGMDRDTAPEHHKDRKRFTTVQTD